MIRLCSELGLHRKSKTDEECEYSGELKRRTFWSIYHLERRIALVLGRPFAISDDEIDISLPLDAKDDAEISTCLYDYNHDHQAPSSSRAVMRPTAQFSVSFHVRLILLDQLNTRARLTLCRLAKGVSESKAEKKVTKLFQELEDWRNAIFAPRSSSKEFAGLMSSTFRTPVQTPPSRPVLQEHERLTLLLGYHRARRILLQTILTDIKIPNQAFEYSSFAKSSGEVCQLNRRLHRLKSVPFTLLDLHSVFVAGFSMIYCAWIDPDLYDAEMAADFGACSTVLYVITEQWASAKKYRDAFEVVAEKTAEFVLSTRQSSQGEQPIASPDQQPGRSKSVGGSGVFSTTENSLAEHQASDMERSWNEDWANEGSEVWQLMNQFVQTQDYNLEYNAVNFTGIEELLAEEGLGWFYGNRSGGP